MKGSYSQTVINMVLEKTIWCSRPTENFAVNSIIIGNPVRYLYSRKTTFFSKGSNPVDDVEEKNRDEMISHKCLATSKPCKI